MNRYLVLFLVLGLLAGCRGEPAPTPDVTATRTPVAEAAVRPPTATALPSTATPLPPTATALPPTAAARPPTSEAGPVAGPSPSVRYNAPGDHVVHVLSGDQERSFRLHVPPDYRPGVPLPLVIDLHGRGGSGFGEELLSGMSAKADEEGFIVVYPQALGAPATWYVDPGRQGMADVVFLRDLIDFLEERLSLDPARFYATGFSNGGGMADRLGCLLSGRLAAIAPVSGVYPAWKSCRPARPLPVVAFHGSDDAIVPYDGGPILPPIPEWAAAWAERNGCDPSPAVTYPEGDVRGETWEDCDGGATVRLYTVQGGGHRWPGSRAMPGLGSGDQGLVATEVIWEFFEAHPLPGRRQ